MERSVRRSITDAIYPIIGQAFAQTQGYTSPKALKYVGKPISFSSRSAVRSETDAFRNRSFWRCASRTHQAKDELRKLFRAVVGEFAFIFKQAHPEQTAIKPADLIAHFLASTDATVRTVARFVLHYVAAVLVFEDGVRNNDSARMRAGRMAFMPIWFGRNHPIYRQIVLHDELQRLRLPIPVLEQAVMVEAVTKCLDDKCEGALFTTDFSCRSFSLL
jgi:hypothetical protein